MFCPTSMRSFIKVASVMMVVVIVKGSAIVHKWKARVWKKWWKDKRKETVFTVFCRHWHKKPLKNSVYDGSSEVLGAVVSEVVSPDISSSRRLIRVEFR
jgi:hypothetical protein